MLFWWHCCITTQSRTKATSVSKLTMLSRSKKSFAVNVFQLHDDAWVLARCSHPEADLQTAGGGAGQSAAVHLWRGGFHTCPPIKKTSQQQHEDVHTHFVPLRHNLPPRCAERGEQDPGFINSKQQKTSHCVWPRSCFHQTQSAVSCSASCSWWALKWPDGCLKGTLW